MKLTDEEKAALVAVEALFRKHDLWAARFRDDDEERWELTTHQREPGQHWHGHGRTLLDAIEDLLHSKSRTP